MGLKFYITDSWIDLLFTFILLQRRNEDKDEAVYVK